MGQVKSLIRHDWTVEEVSTLLHSPLDSLSERAREIHLRYGAQDIQKCMLLSIKTGGCPEDCAYCSQSAHYETEVDSESLVPLATVVERARSAKGNGATRFCMGAAWRQVPDDERFDRVIQMIEAVAQLGVEVCCTLGMATQSQLERMKAAGLTAYNHNLDTSREFYPRIISTRSYDDRLETLRAARGAGVQLCCGGILGMGESSRDRAAWLRELACMVPHPESVPINLLVPIGGTPLEAAPPVPFDEFLRVVATARVLMPQTRVRLSAGRNRLSRDEQSRCFAAGANSIFVGEKLLTAPNVSWEADEQMLAANLPLPVDNPPRACELPQADRPSHM